MTAPAWQRSPALPRGFLFDAPPYLLPAGIVGGEVAAAAVVGGSGWPLAGLPLAFTAVAVIWRDGQTARLAVAPFAAVLDWAEREVPEAAQRLYRLGKSRPDWAGLSMDRPRIMGIVNTTPDSFSDGGAFLAAEAAIAHGRALAAAGADLVDVGGESTRPGAPPVPPDEEMARVLPVVRALAESGLTVSVDTRHASVMEAAVADGARVVNDVCALREPGALDVAARSGADVCLMHMQGEPRTMQADPHYASAPLDVYDFLAERVAACEAAGIDRHRVAVDPGIGFGKTLDHNLQILGALPLLHGLDCPVLLGASRKSFIARLSRGEPPTERLPGSLAAAMMAAQAGAQILRVHDVAETRQALSACLSIV